MKFWWSLCTFNIQQRRHDDITFNNGGGGWRRLYNGNNEQNVKIRSFRKGFIIFIYCKLGRSSSWLNFQTKSAITVNILIKSSNFNQCYRLPWVFSQEAVIASLSAIVEEVWRDSIIKRITNCLEIHLASILIKCFIVVN